MYVFGNHSARNKDLASITIHRVFGVVLPFLLPFRNSSKIHTPEPLAADGFPDAAEMFVDVGKEASGNELLDGHGRSVRENGPAPRQLIVAQAPQYRGGRHRALFEERNRLSFGAIRVFWTEPLGLDKMC